MKTLKNLFLDELADIYDAERRIARGLPKLAKAATSPGLKKAMDAHSKETAGHVKKLELVFKSIGAKPRGKTCEATVGLLEESEEMAADFKGSPALNAGLIAAAQKIEHYEMASYGCLHERAEVLGYVEGARLLRQILDQEKASNDVLNELAHSCLNDEALGESIGSASVEAVAVGSASRQRAVRPVKPRPAGAGTVALKLPAKM